MSLTSATTLSASQIQGPFGVLAARRGKSTDRDGPQLRISLTLLTPTALLRGPIQINSEVPMEDASFNVSGFQRSFASR